MTNVYGQDEEGDISDNEISSQLGSELVTNETVPLADNQNDTSMLNFSESGVREFDNLQLQCEETNLLIPDIKLSDGSIGSWARGSVNLTN